MLPKKPAKKKPAKKKRPATSRRRLRHLAEVRIISLKAPGAAEKKVNALLEEDDGWRLHIEAGLLILERYV